ncbi:uncharacterized protein [Coffea arabica]|uniref:Retrotransposon gag domain-containing protein n=1 Tax=Coffea arabica TaxID=13443 RepID=A0ABM4VC95_COFAR
MVRGISIPSRVSSLHQTFKGGVSQILRRRFQGVALQFTKDIPSWEEYVKAIAARFVNVLYDDPMGDLKRLKQNESVFECQERFEELLNRMDLSEEYAISCFLSTLRDDIQMAVRIFMPRTLQHAVGLAKLEESKIMGAGRKFQKIGQFQGSISRPSIHGSKPWSRLRS